MKNQPWLKTEDLFISARFMKVGPVTSHQKQAECFNNVFHKGEPVRTSSDVRQREITLLRRNKVLLAVEAAWYAMEKHAPELCKREIKTTRAILESCGRLPTAKEP